MYYANKTVPRFFLFASLSLSASCACILPLIDCPVHVAARLVYHTGYGNAAGLLFKKNLLTGDAKQMPATQLHAHLLPKATASKSTKKEAPEDVSSDEEPARHFLHVAREDEHVNPITGAQEKNTTAADTMTMEEKEQETERLLDLFHRMEKNGMIQVVQSFPE